jgi:hypothetical protein
MRVTGSEPGRSKYGTPYNVFLMITYSIRGNVSSRSDSLAREKQPDVLVAKTAAGAALSTLCPGLKGDAVITLGARRK